mgnify:CR=1 FL=1
MADRFSGDISVASTDLTSRVSRIWKYRSQAASPAGVMETIFSFPRFPARISFNRSSFFTA